MTTTTSHPLPSPRQSERGFTIVELIVGLGVTLVVLAGAFELMHEAARSSAQAVSVTDVNQTMRVAMNMIIRDLIQAGEGDFSLRTGVSIPHGDGAAPLYRPSPDDQEWEFPASYTVLPAVSPANALGPEINGVRTDVVTLLFQDRRLDFSGVIPSIPASGASMNLPNSFEFDDEATGIKDGDFIRFGSGAMQLVTNVAGHTLHFQADDWSNVNQRDAPEGSVMALKGDSNQFPDLPISRITMITYYIKVSDTGMPELVRRVNYGPERVVAVGIENLQFSWDLVDGVTNPINVETFTDVAEGQIRKANVFISGRSQSNANNGQPARASLATSVSLRSMAFVSRYDIEP